MEKVYRWNSRSLNEHFLHAFNLDRLASKYWRPPDLLPEGDPSFGWEGFFDEPLEEKMGLWK